MSDKAIWVLSFVLILTSIFLDTRDGDWSTFGIICFLGWVGLLSWAILRGDFEN